MAATLSLEPACTTQVKSWQVCAKTFLSLYSYFYFLYIEKEKFLHPHTYRNLYSKNIYLLYFMISFRFLLYMCVTRECDDEP
jgi:hypothetical protein